MSLLLLVYYFKIANKIKDNERVRWSKKIAAEGVEFNFYEYSSPPSSSSLSIPKGPRCVILFTQFLKEITGDFKQEMRDAKRISEELNCQTLVIYTFCDATAFPHSFVSQVKSSLSSSNSIKVNRTVISSAWRETKDNNIGDIFGKNVSTADFQFSAYGTLFYSFTLSLFLLILVILDPSPQMEDVLDKLTLVMSSFAGNINDMIKKRKQLLLFLCALLMFACRFVCFNSNNNSNQNPRKKQESLQQALVDSYSGHFNYYLCPCIQKSSIYSISNCENPFYIGILITFLFLVTILIDMQDGIRKYLFNIARGVCSKLVGTR